MSVGFKHGFQSGSTDFTAIVANMLLLVVIVVAVVVRTVAFKICCGCFCCCCCCCLQGVDVVVVVRWYRLHCCSPSIQGESIAVLCCSLAVR